MFVGHEVTIEHADRLVAGTLIFRRDGVEIPHRLSAAEQSVYRRMKDSLILDATAPSVALHNACFAASYAMRSPYVTVERYRRNARVAVDLQNTGNVFTEEGVERVRRAFVQVAPSGARFSLGSEYCVANRITLAAAADLANELVVLSRNAVLTVARHADH